MPPPLSIPYSPYETARYTHEMLESLREIAIGQQQTLLAHLLHMAALEAEALCDYADQETSLPA